MKNRIISEGCLDELNCAENQDASLDEDRRSLMKKAFNLGIAGAFASVGFSFPGISAHAEPLVDSRNRCGVKVMAVVTFRPMTAEQQEQYMPKQVPGMLQLYLQGEVEQFWQRDQRQGVFLLMNVASVEEAGTLLNALPLQQAGLMSYELMPVGPLMPLGMLI